MTRPTPGPILRFASRGVPAGLAMVAAAQIVAVVAPAAALRAEVPPFATQTPPPPPDYDSPAAWAAGPFGPGASTALPAGASRAARRPAADVFYVHPTTFKSQDRWNQDLADSATNRWTDASVIARQAGAFSGCCKVYAPRYRQASFLNRDSDRDKAMELAYSDVARAFDWFLAHRDPRRPFILAGHSQGGWMIAALLERKVQGTPLQARLIAAYIIGINLGEGEFGPRFKGVNPCETPAQTGCVVQWNALLPSANLPVMAGLYQSTYVKAFGDNPGKLTLCINPLTFDRSRPAAPATASRGAVPGDPGEGAPQPLVAGKVAARCEQGLLVVEPDPALGLKPLPGGVMHYHDIGLFYADLRANAVLRTAAWQRAHRAHRADRPAR
ncbi:DUF3089 domain-containing protein [Novosphingobium piscinae]|uniref:DUF3089 domain-containing protein n=1 Tax=Novosphingobium piscinae TaxID=1507448 RepID=A0A7X1KQN2_9SPHN|nr:DUF3089 domain-containing protein [Novosphingobium piscinae]MBC2669896.1 DUF3089 domain-containing protein [Novosphingobium piscinae]